MGTLRQLLAVYLLICIIFCLSGCNSLQAPGVSDAPNVSTTKDVSGKPGTTSLPDLSGWSTLDSGDALYEARSFSTRY